MITATATSAITVMSKVMLFDSAPEVRVDCAVEVGCAGAMQKFLK
jgi:hypothetical protein